MKIQSAEQMKSEDFKTEIIYPQIPTDKDIQNIIDGVIPFPIEELSIEEMIERYGDGLSEEQKQLIAIKWAEEQLNTPEFKEMERQSFKDLIIKNK